MDASNKDLPSFECVYQTLKAVGRNCRSRRQVLWWFQTIGIDCEFRLSRIRISSRNDRLGREPAQGECQLEPRLAIATVLFMPASIVRLPPSVHDTCDHTFAPPGIAGTAARPMRTSSSTTCCSPSASRGDGLTCCRMRSPRVGCRPGWAARARKTPRLPDRRLDDGRDQSTLSLWRPMA